MRNRQAKRVAELRKMQKRRAVKQIPAEHHVMSQDQGEQEHLEFLIEILVMVHARVFGSEASVVPFEIGGFVKYVLEMNDTVCFITLDPPANFIPGYTMPVGHSMFFVGILQDAPVVHGKKLRGFYAINRKPFFEKWLANAKKRFEGLSAEAFRDIERANIVQLIAHEVRHEFQYFCVPKYHSIGEIAKIRPDVFGMWQRRELSIFRSGFSEEQIRNDEDALVVEIMVQQLCCSGAVADKSFFDKVATLVRS